MLVVLCCALALVLLLLILGTVYAEHMLSLINRAPDDSTMSPEEYEQFLADQTDPSDPGFTGPVIDDVTWGDDIEVVEQGEHIINVVLVGQDRRPGESRQRSDVMILCTVNTKNGTLTMTSFMRDMYVQIPGYNDNRINACYQLGGMDLLAECLKKNFGVQVDGMVEVDFNGFVDVINLVGGVDIELTASEANYLNAHPDLGDAAGQSWNLVSGMNHLDGNQALGYSRIRNLGDGDFDRTGRQRNVLNAVFDKCKSMNLTKLNELLESALQMVTTNLSNAQILNYMIEVFPLLLNLNITSQRIPADGTFQHARINNMSVLVPDLEANSALLRDSLTE